MSNLNCGSFSVTPRDRWRACVTHAPEERTRPGTAHRQRRNAGAQVRSPQGDLSCRRDSALERLGQLRAEEALVKAMAKAYTIDRSSP